MAFAAWEEQEVLWQKAADPKRGADAALLGLTVLAGRHDRDPGAGLSKHMTVAGTTRNTRGPPVASMSELAVNPNPQKTILNHKCMSRLQGDCNR